ncbi:MAG: hypothetical protein ACE5FU_14255, partial [Nitrospinota bacterium]
MFLIKTVTPITGTVFCSIFLTWLYGSLLTAGQIESLKSKARFIEEIPDSLSFPSQVLLSELSLSFSLRCGAFFGLSLGPFLGVLVVLAILLTNRSANGTRVLPGVCAVFSFALCFFVGSRFSPWISIPFFLLLPFALLFCYQTISGFLSVFLETRNTKSYGKPTGMRGEGGSLAKFVSVLCLLLFSLGVLNLSTPLLRVFSVKQGPDIFIAVRDRVLLSNPVGKFINNYYYVHSPYAAEVIKPLIKKGQFSILYLGENTNSSVFFEREKEKLKHFAGFVSSEAALKRNLEKGGFDLIFADIETETGRNFYATLSSLKVDLQKRIVVVTGDKEPFLTNQKNQQVFIEKPLSFKKINRAIQSVSASTDHVEGLRRLIGFSLHDFFLLTFVGLFFSVSVVVLLVFLVMCRLLSRYFCSKPGVVFLGVLILFTG